MKTSINIFNELNESLDKELKSKKLAKQNKLTESAKLNEANWKLTLDNSIRKAIREEDLEGIIEALKHYNDVVQNSNVDEFIKEEFQSFMDDYEMDFEDLFADDNPEEVLDYILGEFYDLCDNTGVFIEIGESEESHINESTFTKGDKYKNQNGVVCEIIDVDNEHLLDGEPQVTYRMGRDTKCYRASSVEAMLKQNNYIKESANTTDEERLASLKMQLEKDADQLADDEKEAIKKEIADLEAKVYPIDESEELTNINTKKKDKLNHIKKGNLKEAQEWVITYVPDANQKDKTATVSVSGMNKRDAIQKARNTIKDAAVVSIQPLQEEDVVVIPKVEDETDYIIKDVTVLNTIENGDVQAPDIDALINIIDEDLKSEYKNNWGKIKILSSKVNENSSFALVDITTPEILKEFEDKNIHDIAIGNNLILERVGNLYQFRVNSLSGATKYIKKTTDPKIAIKEWIESEFLREAKNLKEEELAILKQKTEKETVENYINNRLDLKQELANIQMFIDLAKQTKSLDDMKPAIQKRMYGLAVEMPNNIEIINTDNKYELKFNTVDDIVNILFGKEWIKEVREDNKVIGLKEKKVNESENSKADNLIKDYFNNKIKTLDELHDKLEKLFKTKKDAVEYLVNNESRLKKEAKMNESYEQFNIGEIEVVFNPDTYECLYSIPSADVKDKKINLADVPTVDTPYDTNTIIKDYVETKFGRISSPDVEEPEAEPTEEPVEEPVDRNTEITTSPEEPVENNDEMHEDELPDEPESNKIDNINTDEEPSQEVVEPETEENQAETGSETFVKIRPNQHTNIEDVRKRKLEANTPESNYIVVDEISIPEEEWEDLNRDFTIPRDFLNDIKSLDRKNYSFNVVKVTSPKAQYSLLIDPLGYGYARYLAISDNNIA